LLNEDEQNLFFESKVTYFEAYQKLLKYTIKALKNNKRINETYELEIQGLKDQLSLKIGENLLEEERKEKLQA